MAKVDLGEKQLCPECEKKFYDLTKRPAQCPYCQHSFDPASIAPVAKVTVDIKDTKTTSTAEDETETEEDLDEDEIAAKELELDGDAANFSGVSGDDDGNPDINAFSSDDDDDEDSALINDDEDDVLPPTGGDDDDDDEVDLDDKGDNNGVA